MTLTKLELLKLYWRELKGRIESNGIVKTGRRGEYKVLPPEHLRRVVAPYESDISPKLKAIVDAEYNLIKNHDKSDELGLYTNDEVLHEAYASFNFDKFKTGSRNNVTTQDKCCIQSFNLTSSNTLCVTWRSTDVQRAFLSDFLVCMRIAQDLGADELYITMQQPHIYTDKTKIARREP